MMPEGSYDGCNKASKYQMLPIKGAWNKKPKNQEQTELPKYCKHPLKSPKKKTLRQKLSAWVGSQMDAVWVGREYMLLYSCHMLYSKTLKRVGIRL